MVSQKEGVCELRGEVVEEGASSLNGKCVGQLEEVLVAGDENGPLLLGERQQVVISGISGSACGMRWVGTETPSVANDRDEGAGFVCRDSFAQLRVGESPFELGE